MATREENLKKLNDELEKLSDEELDNVAGGKYYETGADSRFLHDVGLMDERFSNVDVVFDDARISSKVTEAWNKIGISVETYFACDNVYKKEGEEITRKQAIKYACKTLSKKLQNLPGGYDF